jgi:hypothetical protein
MHGLNCFLLIVSLLAAWVAFDLFGRSYGRIRSGKFHGRCGDMAATSFKLNSFS